MKNITFKNDYSSSTQMVIASKTHYLALLRGINVGGNNIIKMVDLCRCFIDMGFSGVKTYIQSGNVIFASDETDQIYLTRKIEKVLSETFAYHSTVVIVSQNQMKGVIELAPEGFGIDRDTYKYDVVFIKEPATATEAIIDIKTSKDVDIVVAANGVLYFSRLISKSSQSYLSKIITLPIYKFMTIRNLNTTLRLYEMMNQ